MISSMFSSEVVTVSTGIINQRKLKPNKLDTQQKEIENSQLKRKMGGESYTFLPLHK